MSLRVGVNGFGRIGRGFLRAVQGHNEIEVVAINDLTDIQTIAHLFKYDSVHGTFRGQLGVQGGSLLLNDKPIKVCSCSNPEDILWREYGVDVVLESTGIFTAREYASRHLAAGARKVVVSAPATDEDVTIVMGVNHHQYDPDHHHIISNASCTTNCLAPVAKILNDNFGIESGLVTTVHAYTNDQRILDLPHKDLRRARAGAVSMIPTTTGAAKAVSKVLPELKGKLDGMSIRVPTPNVSLADIVVNVSRKTDAAQVNSVLKDAACGSLNGIMGFEEVPLVSVDYNGNTHSSVIDASCTKVMNGSMVKVLAWYDNECGFSNRLVDLLGMIGRRW